MNLVSGLQFLRSCQFQPHNNNTTKSLLKYKKKKKKGKQSNMGPLPLILQLCNGVTKFLVPLSPKHTETVNLQCCKYHEVLAYTCNLY